MCWFCFYLRICRKLNIKIWFTRPEFYDFYVALCCCCCCWACCRDRKDSMFKHRLKQQTIANVVLVVCVGIVMLLCACLGLSRSSSQLSWSLYVCHCMSVIVCLACHCMFSMSLSLSCFPFTLTYPWRPFGLFPCSLLSLFSNCMYCRLVFVLS